MNITGISCDAQSVYQAETLALMKNVASDYNKISTHFNMPLDDDLFCYMAQVDDDQYSFEVLERNSDNPIIEGTLIIYGGITDHEN